MLVLVIWGLGKGRRGHALRVYVPGAGDSGGGISRDEYIGKVARDIQNKLPILFDLDVIRKKFGLEVSPTTVVLLQELERFNRLIVRMSRSLAELQKVRKNGGKRERERIIVLSL